MRVYVCVCVHACVFKKADLKQIKTMFEFEFYF